MRNGNAENYSMDSDLTRELFQTPLTGKRVLNEKGKPKDL